MNHAKAAKHAALIEKEVQLEHSHYHAYQHKYWLSLVFCKTMVRL